MNTMKNSFLFEGQMGRKDKCLLILYFFAGIFFLFCHTLYPAFAQGESERYKRLRYQRVEQQLVERGIKDEKVLKAIRDVPRHLFVPEKYRESAYGDFPLPIGYGQTIPQPYIGALMTELLDPKEGDVALEVGTGSGYQAAVLGRIVSKIYTIEIISPLGKEAKKRFEILGYKNVTVKVGDGYLGWNAHAPFDCIIVTAVSTHVPPPLIQQLKKGGKMVIPLGNPFQIQNLMLIEKSEEGDIKTKNVLPVRFAPLVRKWR